MSKYENTSQSQCISSDASSGQSIKEKIVLALKKVEDPEIHINIVDLGLVYRIDVFEEGKRLEIDFTLTTPGCPLADVIEDNILSACREVLPHANITLQIVWTPMWHADFMSEDARVELGFPV